jgi:hypothetical protein
LASACSIGRPGVEAVMSRAVCMAFSPVHPVDVRLAGSKARLNLPLHSSAFV